MTTHSPFSIAAASQASLWYVDHEGKVGVLEPKKTARHRKTDPETFLARLTVVTEGATECGFVTALLEKTLDSSLEQHGVHVSDGGGHESTLGLLEALAEGGLRFGGFADDEGGKHPERWKKVTEKLDKLLFRWTSGCLEENIINAVPDENLKTLVIVPDGNKTGMRLRTLADLLGSQEKEKDFVAIKTKAGTGLKALIVGAASGNQGQIWFKTVAGGGELAGKMFSLGAWSALKLQLLPFVMPCEKRLILRKSRTSFCE